ncbi:MAG: glycosyl transferase family 39 [uncultured bacterium]|nr:MAG: glycosyl transferase family 39 [uncultured bacterium]
MLPINKNPQNLSWYLILAIIIFFSFYFALGSYPLLNNNEGLYASIAKHMLLNKQFVIPHLNCVPYIEKPPMLYWLLTLSFSAFGFTAFAARLVTATSAALLCIALLFFTNKIKQSKIGITATLIFASSIGISIIARMVYFDMLLTLLVSSTLFCLFYWYETNKIIALRIGYVLLGCAILTKGLIAIVLVGGSFGSFLLWEKSFWKQVRLALDWPGMVLFLATVLPWHIAAIIQHKGFFWNYIIGEHFLRFLDLREPHDYYHGPLYYYLPRILIYLFPWSLFIPLIFLRNKNKSTATQKLLRFSWCCLLIPLAFFSFSSAKANYYMVVGIPALTIILSVKLNSFYESKHQRFFNVLIAVFLLTIAMSILLIFITFVSSSPALIGFQKTIAAIVVYSLIAAIISLIFIRRPQVAAVAFAGLIIPIAFAATMILKSISEDISAANAGTYLTQNGQNSSIYLYQDFENISAIAFYTNSCLKIIDSQSSDLHYGSRLPQSKPWFLSKDEFLQETRNKLCYIVVPTKKLDQFYQDMAGTKFKIPQKYKGITVISKDE